jgi:hypothetical protein
MTRGNTLPVATPNTADETNYYLVPLFDFQQA